jgi:2-iminoacetate synthase ThiH
MCEKDLAERIEALEAAAKAQMAVILGTIGGTVEGRPTSALNYLQRLRQLVENEDRHRL